jgi:hypothetical protein
LIVVVVAVFMASWAANAALGCADARAAWEDDAAEESLTSSASLLTTPIGCWCADQRGNVYESKVEVWPWQELPAARQRCFDDIARSHPAVRGLQCSEAHD